VSHDELLQRFGDLAAFGRNPAIQFLGDFLGSIARPAFDRIESNDPEGLLILAGEKVFDDRRDIGLALVSFSPGGAGTEVLKHEVDVPIEPIGGNNRGRLTHTQLHNTESHVGRYCRNCESVWAFEEGNFPVKVPDLDIPTRLALSGFRDRLVIVLGVEVEPADDVAIIVNVIGVVVRHSAGT